MKQIFLDIETVPGDIPDYPEFDSFAVKPDPVKPHGNLKDPKKIIAYEQKKLKENLQKAKDEQQKGYEDALKEYNKDCKKQSLSSINCQVVCLAFAIDDEDVDFIYGKDERHLFQLLLKHGVWSEISNTSITPRFCAFNAIGFDLAVLGAKLFKYFGYNYAKYIPYNVKPWDTHRVYDPQQQFPSTSAHNYPSQDDIARHFGFVGKDGMTGADVLPYYLDGKLHEICEYCVHDVEVLREICHFMWGSTNP